MCLYHLIFVASDSYKMTIKTSKIKWTFTCDALCTAHNDKINGAYMWFFVSFNKKNTDGSQTSLCVYINFYNFETIWLCLKILRLYYFIPKNLTENIVSVFKALSILVIIRWIQYY